MDDALKLAEEEFGITMKTIQQAKEYEVKQTVQRFIPYISSVTNNWRYSEIVYKDVNGPSSKDAYVESEIVRTLSNANINGMNLLVIKYTLGDIYQVKEPEKKINEEFSKLFNETNWYKVDGINGIVENKDSQYMYLSSKISKTGDFENALEMIAMAGKASDDAKLIFRELKEWLVENGVQMKDEYIWEQEAIEAKKEEGTTSSEIYDPENISEDRVSSTKAGGIFGNKTVPVAYVSKIANIKASELQSGTTVRSVVAGEITEISGDMIQIKATSPSKIKGDTVIISGAQFDSALTPGMKVSKTTPIGETVSGKDITIQMQDKNKRSISVQDNLTL